jgi:hypothetical protein
VPHHLSLSEPNLPRTRKQKAPIDGSGVGFLLGFGLLFRCWRDGPGSSCSSVTARSIIYPGDCVFAPVRLPVIGFQNQIDINYSDAIIYPLPKEPTRTAYCWVQESPIVYTSGVAFQCNRSA